MGSRYMRRVSTEAERGCVEFARKHGLDEADVLELFNERAAIREFDGGMTREEAEKAALIDVVAQFSSRSA